MAQLEAEAAERAEALAAEQKAARAPDMPPAKRLRRNGAAATERESWNCHACERPMGTHLLSRMLIGRVCACACQKTGSRTSVTASPSWRQEPPNGCSPIAPGPASRESVNPARHTNNSVRRGRSQRHGHWVRLRPTIKDAGPTRGTPNPMR
jgi:hypothetical protein